MLRTQNAHLMVMILCTIAGSISAVADESINFDRDVRTILSDKCFYCHGPDQEHREADLRLDRQEDAKNVITAGDPEASEMILRILANDETIMPPADSKKALTEDEINILKYIISLVEDIPYLKLVGYAQDIQKGKKELVQLQPDFDFGGCSIKRRQ